VGPRREIWPADHVMSYQNQLDIGRGSFALHSNLFRYALLFEMGGWWTDLDVVLLRPELPQQEIFFSIESLDPLRATFPY
jgi:Glycosyltransferase sugar-binding region containing DXD motif